MKIVLPFNYKPECIVYHNIAFPLGIIKANLINYDEWLSEKLILCRFNHDDDCFNFWDDDIWGWKRQYLVDTQFIEISPFLINTDSIKIVDYIKFLINNNFYIIGTCDEYYIPGKANCLKRHFVHDYIIFGYNDGEDVFYSAGYTSDWRYSPYTIKYDDYKNSIINIEESRVRFWFHKIYRKESVNADIAIIRDSISDYLNSKNPDTSTMSNSDFGISACEELAAFFLKAEEGIDLRNSRAFMEHKFIMLKRMETIFNKGVFFNKRLIEEYKKLIFQKAQNVYYLSIKYNMIFEKKILYYIAELIKKICINETSILSELIDKIT